MSILLSVLRIPERDFLSIYLDVDRNHSLPTRRMVRSGFYFDHKNCVGIVHNPILDRSC